MSRTIHTTPAFPRTLRGPRGGRHTAPTPCVECVSFTSCRPGSCSAPFGCESWTDESGRRIEPDPRIDYGEPDRPCRMDPDEPCSDCRNCETMTPDPLDPDPYAPSAATLQQMSGIFPTDDNAPEPEPDGGRFTFETLGGLVKGKCGSSRTTETTDDPGPLFAGR